MDDEGGLGAFLKSGALRLLLRPFWDKRRAVVATWLSEYCIEFLAAIYVRQLTSNFYEGSTSSATASLLAIGQIVNSRAPEIAIYLRTYFRASFIAAA